MCSKGKICVCGISKSQIRNEVVEPAVVGVADRANSFEQLFRSLGGGRGVCYETEPKFLLWLLALLVPNEVASYNVVCQCSHSSTATVHHFSERNLWRIGCNLRTPKLFITIATLACCELV